MYASDAARYAQQLQQGGLSVTRMSALEHRWEDIEPLGSEVFSSPWRSLMANIKAESIGEQRVLFVLGDETYMRRLLCASITARRLGDSESRESGVVR